MKIIDELKETADLMEDNGLSPEDTAIYLRAISEIRKLEEALKDANEMCRSMASIAMREGSATNWEAFSSRLKESLDRQHAVIHQPKAG